MKYTLLVIGILFFLFSFIPLAQGLSFGLSPAGGKVTSTTKGNVTCTGGTGPVTNRPAGSSPPASYFYPAGGGGSTGGSKSAPRNNDWVVTLYSGFYSFSDCYTQVGPYRIPYPVYKIKLFGKSN